VPFDDLPQILNPRDGILVSANNRIVGPDYPHLVTADWPAGFRARRIEEKLANQPKFSPAEVAALQLDIYSSGAAHLLPILLDLTDGNEDNEDALEVLGVWDFAMDRHATEPIIYYAWITALNEILISDELGELWRDFQRPDAAVIAQILTGSPQWCDDIATIERTESCRETVTSALDEGLGYLHKRFQTRMDRWRWGEAHNAPFDHPIFSRVPFFGDLLSYGLEVDGGDTTINRGGTRFGGNGDTLFQSIHGAGFRAVYDLSNLENSRFMIATGQSGNPLSPYYGNFTAAWQNGENFILNGASSSGDDVLTLQPQ
jgi:penicillin amidase